ncbi:MAG: hypothetical protein Aurels2KO_26190 [Aureliella sp.]
MVRCFDVYRLANSFFLVAILYASLQAPSDAQIRFEDVTESTGITFQHTDGSTGKYYLIESMSAGLALLDFDQDGDMDIYFLNGSEIDSASDQSVEDAKSASNALYRNDGGMQFVDITSESGTGDTRMGLGVSVADFDNDGWPDLYLNNYGPNVFYRNNGDGTFDDIAETSATQNGSRVGGGVSFADFNNDGNLDIYVANYIQFSLADYKPHIHKGLPAYPSPISFRPDHDTIYLSDGDGAFRDYTEASGIGKLAGRSMGVITLDYDGDGDQDILVANDTQENHLLENDGQARFTEAAIFAGVAYDFNGKPQASMGIDIADFNHDGQQDIAVTSFSEEFTTIYTGAGAGFYDDLTSNSGAGPATFPHVTWGVSAFDADNDGNADLLVAAGDLDDQRTSRGGASTTTGFHVPNIMLAGDGTGHFKDLAEGWGSAGKVAQSTRGLVTADLDGDGRLDAVATNARAGPTVYKNAGAANQWTEIRLVGRAGNRDGIGATVKVTSDSVDLHQTVIAGRSYQSASAAPLHFGLGKPEPDDQIRVTVRWPSGVTSDHSTVQGSTKHLFEPPTGTNPRVR